MEHKETVKTMKEISESETTPPISNANITPPIQPIISTQLTVVNSVPPLENNPSPDNITVDHLTNVIQNLTEKISALETKLSELNQIRRKLNESEKIRIDLSSCLKESAEKNAQHKENEEKFKAEIIEEKERLIQEIQQLREELQKMTDDKNIFETECLKNKGKIAELDTTLKLQKIDYEDIENMRKNISELEKIIKDLQNENNTVFC